MEINTIALDLEGTLISNAVSVFPRPGLHNFLAFCRDHFDRMVIFTSVPETMARKIMEILVAEGSAPDWFAKLEIFVCERYELKDLKRVGTPDQILLVDDQEAYVLSWQRSQWVPVREFLPPFIQADRELVRVQAAILSKLSQQHLE